MRSLIFAALVASICTPVSAQVRVRGYVRSNGTYVAPHFRTSPDGFKSNNYSAWKSSGYGTTSYPSAYGSGYGYLPTYAPVNSNQNIFTPGFYGAIGPYSYLR
jgi:hypothetical protein